MNLIAVEAIVSALGNLIDAPASSLPTFGRNEDFARPEIQVHNDGYHFIVVERGQELERRIFGQLEELLFHVFQKVTFEMACNHEVKNRIADQDSRILIFTKQLQLLKQIDKGFAEKQRVKCEFYLRGRKLTY
ncbi:Imm63 family immunity protein [Hymenobacter radiodurans]|uniref:Imm63 family immunity protein n=1 Tax=Hymenobacter radiodurans TaxID=2496028 RepID=UPI00105876B4|nr:Imm63 family immunity protein [Hymenobacter radiodurans]